MLIGYACLNQALRDLGFKKRRLYKKQFIEGGLSRVSEIALGNLDHLERVILWNDEHGIRFFRVTQIFPWIDQYEYEDLPQWEVIKHRMMSVGGLTQKLGHRLTVHPSEFCVVASTNDSSVQNSIRELNQIARGFDLMGLERSPFNKINIHVGGVYGDKEATAERFCTNILALGSEELRDRLTLENDDRRNGFSTKDLYELIYRRLKCPIVFDYFHHHFCPGGLTESEALEMAVSTWPPGIRPVVHYSSSRRIHEDPGASQIAHADWIYDRPNLNGHVVDIMIEAKKTERAVLKYRESM